MKLSISFKHQLFSECNRILYEKIKHLSSALNDLTQGGESDAKSSAGDKHETARAMLQIEHENISRQLNEVLNEKNDLRRSELGETSIVTRGSVVKTNRGCLFVGIALGKITVDNIPVIVLSPQSPIGKKLLGLAVGASVVMNGTQYLIEEIL